MPSLMPLKGYISRIGRLTPKQAPDTPQDMDDIEQLRIKMVKRILKQIGIQQVVFIRSL